METKNFFKTMWVALCCLATFSMVACDDDDDNTITASLKLSQTSATINPAATTTVTVSNGTSPYTVASSDSKVATAKVDKTTITITGVKEGTAVITVTDKNKFSGKVAVTVKSTASNSLTFDKSSTSIATGKEDVVTVKNGTSPYTATSKDTSIATVTVADSKITIKGVKAGSTTITVTDKDKKTGTISVTVK